VLCETACYIFRQQANSRYAELSRHSNGCGNCASGAMIPSQAPGICYLSEFCLDTDRMFTNRIDRINLKVWHCPVLGWLTHNASVFRVAPHIHTQKAPYKDLGRCEGSRICIISSIFSTNSWGNFICLILFLGLSWCSLRRFDRHSSSSVTSCFSVSMRLALFMK